MVCPDLNRTMRGARAHKGFVREDPQELSDAVLLDIGTLAEARAPLRGRAVRAEAGGARKGVEVGRLGFGKA